MIEELKDKVKEIWQQHSHCVIWAVAGFVVGAIIL
tara:strand:- start:287 stop:391 length:105 start_codon:yes stop_codon:yes gene_type:complete